MRRGMMRALLWALATTVAMAVSWYGVRTVLAGTAYEPPRALPISGAAAPTTAVPATRAPAPTPSAPPSRPVGTEPPPTPRVSPPSPSAPEPDSGGSAEAPSPERGAGEVKSFQVRGGRAVFDLGESAATLVSATPDEGWRMRVWKQTAWIRVDFVAGERTTSVFVTWNGHPPHVRTVEG
ncbi:hypothetical protein LUZ64_28295 [Streptomyces albireticuli]|nr:hypothetical protein [Streptomyces albireticuli]MCD9195093.1 hypothetical protein [Streptomyces albireticuli]